MPVNTVTQEQIDNIIAQSSFEVFHRVHEKQCLVVAKLPNGFTVVGESACVDPNNYDEQIGYDLAVKHIKNRLWELEGYALQNKLYGQEIDSLVRDIMKPKTVTLHEGEMILPAYQLAEGHIRYSQSSYVGDHSNDMTIEGAVDDVLKIIQATDK